MHRRIKFTVEYNGAPFHGWQRQQGLPTVQGHIERALFDVTKEEITLTVSGRTDAGVHGLAQICHFDTHTQLPDKALLVLVNRHIPKDIRILAAETVDTHFHARFSAKARSYEFRLLCRNHPSAILRQQTTHVPYDIDLDKMNIAAQDLIGEHDFSAFRTSECASNTPICHIKKATFTTQGDVTIFHITADHFLHNMIRIIVGTLIEIGRGKLPETAIQKMIATRNRADGGPTIAPHGLYFKKAHY